MTLQIELPAEVEEHLAREAERRGQSLVDYAREVLERSVRRADLSEAVFASYWRDLPRRSPADLAALARGQGIQPVGDPEAITGGWPEDDSVDEFLAARKRWQHQGRTSRTSREGAKG
jgi:hypothetical protein